MRATVLRFICFAICIYLNAINAHAQVFPIHSQVNLTPPYSGNLSDYTSPGSQRIRVSITSRDLTLSNFRVKLRITIEGLGITIRTKQNLVVDPFVIDGASPLTLYGDDLYHYLNPQNLDFVGFSRSEYQRNGKLPEGVYRFYVEVLDYNRGTVVSNKGFTTAWIILNDPPMLNLPAKNSKTRIVDPTNIPFTWTPRHTGSPNAAFTTEYVFRLIEIWPSDRNPNDAFLSQAPLYEVETRQSQIVYGPAEPALIPGRKYAWQVEARDTEGRDLFKNLGKSEVFVFQFGEALGMPQNVRKETANSTTISIRWEASSVGEIPERFRIRYRAVGGSMWFEDVTTQYWHTLASLQINKQYDIQVRAETSTQVSDYTFNQRHSTTLPITDENYQCGQPFEFKKPVMTTPLQYLRLGDIIHCADFDIQVTEVSDPSTPGAFSGKGYAKIYMFNGANIEFAFTGTFNQEYQMVTGSFKSTYQPGNKIDRLKDKMEKIGEEKPVLDADKLDASTLIIITGIVDQVYLNENGEIVVADEDGKTETYEQKKNDKDEKLTMVVKDAAGNSWTVDKNGNITKADAAVAGVYTSRDSLNLVVKFKESETHHYGFDKDNAFPTPSATKVNSKEYFIGWKAVAQGKQDAVDAFIEGSQKFPGKIGFKTESGPASKQPAKEVNASTILVTGGFDGTSQELIAYAKLNEPGKNTESDVVLGKVNVVSYEFISKKLIVVPVSTTTSLDPTQVKAQLNKIYGQAVAGWEVAIDNVFIIDDSFLQKLDEEESGNLASYNQKMRAFIREYKKFNPNYDREAYYIFLIPGNDYQVAGFMPFKRNFGYVFPDKLNNNSDKIIQTIAHELGHGAFHLKHTFSQHGIAERSTQNLMDYGGGQELKKYQWDYVHDPESVIGWFEEDEEVAYESAGIIEILSSSNLQLDPGNIKVNFRLKDWQKKIEASTFAKKSISDYSMLLFVVRHGEIVYSFSKELSQTGNIEWHGLVSVDEEAMTLDNYKEFSLHVGIVPKDYAVSEPFLNYQAFLGSRPETTLLKNGNDIATEVKFVDVIQNIRFKLNLAAFEWDQFEKKDNMQLATFKRYAERRDQYLKRLKQLGIDTDSISPIDYLNEHIVSGDFLGKQIPAINIRYLYVLRRVEEMLGRKKNWAENSSEFKRLVEISPIIQDYARMSSVDEEISDHGMGFAIDFVKNSNIWIDEGENPSIIKFIQLVTGERLSNASLSPEKSKALHNKFLERVRARGLNKDQIVKQFIFIHKLDSAGTFRLIERDTIGYLIKMLRQDLKESLIDLPETAGDKEIMEEMKRRDNYCQLLIDRLAQIRQMSTESVQILSKVNDVLFLFDGRSDDLPTSLLNHHSSQVALVDTLLQAVQSYAPQTANQWNEMLFQFRMDAEAGSTVDNSPTNMIRSIMENKRRILQASLREFAINLRTEFYFDTEIYGKDIVNLGFFSLPVEIVNAVKKQIVQTETGPVYVNWGGDYIGTKDYMHFELRPDRQRKFQIAMHRIDIKQVRDYLNGFTGTNNARYEY